MTLLETTPPLYFLAKAICDKYNIKFDEEPDRGMVVDEDSLYWFMSKTKYPNNFEWVKVEDEMPATNKAVLVYIPAEDDHITSGMWDISNKWVLLDDYRCLQEDAPVTHWMPLPEPPKD